ncbi:DUF6600 domain-containing protein, partial [Azorhizobium sp. AG788]|uniref:DUF6600 domain-containing protein n=1 Tax=Azorhizobium sp. AG788 TaxID=2183897 RepID=UPI003138EBFB
MKTVRDANPQSTPRQALVAGVAASFLLAGLMAPAQAQVSPRSGQGAPLPPGSPANPGAARVDINVFYAPLAEHGSWVVHPVYQYVWVPADLDAAWRPYQEGRWLWTEDGWYWDSAEPFAWATYHYGRWGYEPDYGWYWVPGDTWAPAWVKWRRGGGHTGWAPIAPDAPGYAYGPPRRYDVPVAESWVFVQDQYLVAPDLTARVLPIAALAGWLRSDPRVYDPSFGNGRVATRFVPPTDFGPTVEREVVTRRLVYVDRYQEEFDDSAGARIGIYRPYIARAQQISPPREVMRSVPQDRRVIIRQYVGPDPGNGLAPSAALLSVLSVDQRQSLRDARFSGNQQAYRRDLDQFRDARTQQLQQEWAEAERNRERYERGRLERMRGQEQMQQRVLQQRQQRAADVIQRLEQERPNAVPPALPQAPGAPGGRLLPGAPAAQPTGAPAAPPPGAPAAQPPGAPPPPPA